MLVTQKKQYALRAIFELAKRRGRDPVKASVIADAQAIPTRFLEVILSHLKRFGIVTSKRGYYGGYQLNLSPEELTVGNLFRILEQAEVPEACVTCATKKQNCPFWGNCVFLSLWNRVQNAVNHIYDRTTIQNLLDEEQILEQIKSD